MDYLVTDRRYTIRLCEPFSVPIVKPDNSVTERWEPAFNDSSDWVEILDELSDYDRRTIESEGAQMAYHSATMRSGASLSVTTREAMYLATLKTTIKDWSLAGAQTGTRLPLSEDTFKRLGAVGSWLYDAIEAHYLHQQITPAQLKNFGRVPAPSISAPAPSPESSPTSTSLNGSASTPIESSAYEVEPSSVS